MAMNLSVSQKVISAEAAAKAVSASVAEARRLGVAINAAVVDSGGNLAAFLRMPGAFLHSISIAQDKALTAAGFGLPTSALHDAVQADRALHEGITVRPNLVLFGGGLPIREGDDLLGGIGVSGASVEQDTLCAEAGLVAIGLGEAK
jgi:uncharacterized protein GlcG (DUF336 family)